MKRFTTTIRFFILSILLTISYQANAINYVTMAAGAWDNVTNVWSTDGGVTPCGCSPGGTSGANNITVNHNLSVPYQIDVTAGGSLVVNAGGKMTGTTNFTVSSATLDVFGRINMNKYVQNGASAVQFHPNAIMILSNSSTINAGNGDGTAQLFNLNGRSMLAEEFSAFNNSFELTVPNVEPGVYLLNVKQNDTIRQVRVIITK